MSLANEMMSCGELVRALVAQISSNLPKHATGMDQPIYYTLTSEDGSYQLQATITFTDLTRQQS